MIDTSIAQVSKDHPTVFFAIHKTPPVIVNQYFKSIESHMTKQNSNPELKGLIPELKIDLLEKDLVQVYSPEKLEKMKQNKLKLEAKRKKKNADPTTKEKRKEWGKIRKEAIDNLIEKHNEEFKMLKQESEKKIKKKVEEKESSVLKRKREEEEEEEEENYKTWIQEEEEGDIKKKKPYIKKKRLNK
jgi:hypothetical protein